MRTKSKIVSLALVIVVLAIQVGIVAADDGIPPATGVETQAANGEGTPPALPPNAVTLPAKCNAETGVCVTVFYSAPGKSASDTLTASPTTNQYICGVDVYHYGAWYGRLQQNVYGSYGWSPGAQWKLDSGNLSTSAAIFQWWESLNGPNPDVPWGTLAISEHVASSAWLMPRFEMHWVNAYFEPFGNYSCTGD